MPVAKFPLRDALGVISRLGRSTVVVTNGPTSASLRGEPAFQETGSELAITVGCACEVRVQRDRLRHAVFGPKPGGDGHLQIFDGNYDKVIAFSFPGGAPQLERLAKELDGNDFEISG